MGLGRQTRSAKRSKQKRAKETAEEKERRKEADRERGRWIRENESEEKRQMRRKFARESVRKRRASLKKKRVAAERHGKEIHEVVVLNEPLGMIDSHAPVHFLAAQANEDVKRVLLNEAVARASCTMETLSTEGLILEDAIKVEPSIVEDDEAYS